MSEQYRPNVGYLITEEAFRDAVHIALAPVEAAEDLEANDPVMLVGGQAYKCSVEECIGVVDPFLKINKLKAPKGSTFWLYIRPYTITNLRHTWQHPAFRAKPLGG